VMLGQPISMLLPEVVGYKLTGQLPLTATATDLVLTVTKNLRGLGVVGKFVEFYGPGVENLSIADRATLSNMAPEYGATIGFFPVDRVTLGYLRTTGRSEEKISYIEASFADKASSKTILKRLPILTSLKILSLISQRLRLVSLAPSDPMIESP